MTRTPVVRATSYCMAHVPDLVRYGSKPQREIEQDGAVEARMSNALRSFADAVTYPPNRVYIGALSPDELRSVERPWFQCDPQATPNSAGPFGEIVPQDLFFALLKQSDVLHPPLFALTAAGVDALRCAAAEHPCFTDVGVLTSEDDAVIEEEIAGGAARPIVSDRTLIGCFRPDIRSEGQGDQNLSALHLLEALCSKASGALALQWLLKRSGLAADQVDYIISCGEEACGDRYQRGGGGMAKAIGEMCGCTNASGMDVKNFCAAPASALVTASALVQAGLYEHVAVVAGGSLAKLGMKFEAFLREGIPILDDCLASMAFLVSRDDGHSPIVHLKRGAVGVASVGSSASDEAIYRELILQPLDALGLTMRDIDKYATELHNPEIMQFAGSGDVTHKNYRMVAAIAVLSGQITKGEMSDFVHEIGMPGFAPTQGHIPSAVPYLGHAAELMKSGKMNRAMFLCKASLFLNRITELFDGVSFVVERNPSLVDAGVGSRAE